MSSCLPFIGRLDIERHLFFLYFLACCFLFFGQLLWVFKMHERKFATIVRFEVNNFFLGRYFINVYDDFLDLWRWLSSHYLFCRYVCINNFLFTKRLKSLPIILLSLHRLRLIILKPLHELIKFDYSLFI